MLQNDAASTCSVRVDVVDVYSATVVTQPVEVGESTTPCANKIIRIDTTSVSPERTATYHCRADSYWEHRSLDLFPDGVAASC